jgi:hypothetical protein
LADCEAGEVSFEGLVVEFLNLDLDERLELDVLGFDERLSLWACEAFKPVVGIRNFDYAGFEPMKSSVAKFLRAGGYAILQKSESCIRYSENRVTKEQLEV